MRLFAGIPIPADVTERLVALSGGIPGARWVAPENYHITLRFFGDAQRATAEDLVEALSRLAPQPSQLRLEGVGLFGDRRRQQQLYANVPPQKQLTHLNQKIEQIARQAGFEPEGRRFHPHVTVARMRNPDRQRLQQFLLDRGHLAVPAFDVTGFHLYESRLHSDGAIYTPIARFGMDDCGDITGSHRE